MSACGASGDEETRRFANERPPTVAPTTATVGLSTTPTAPPTAPPAVSPGALVATRGAPERLFFTAANELWTVGADGADPRPLLQLGPDQGEIRATAQAPGVAGNDIAALIAVRDDDRESASLLLLDGNGDELRRVDTLESVLGDDASDGATPTSLTWSPQGNRLLVTFGTGGIVSVPLEGEPTLLVSPEVNGDVSGAAWSPAGDAIAFLAAMEPDADDGARQLIVAPVVDDAVDPAGFTVVSRVGDVVGSFSWLPDGSGLVYAARSAIGDSAGGDLFSVRADGSEPRLVASAGRAAPVAQITEFAVSPDGRSLAYTIATPDSSGERLVFHSLWVRSLDGAAAVLVPIGGNEAVTQLWWTSAGLVWRTQPIGGDEDDPGESQAFSIERLDAQSQQSVLYAVTPVASPVASPGADAAGTPVTPGATPDASASPSAATPE